jgi:hypothetical protein
VSFTCAAFCYDDVAAPIMWRSPPIYFRRFLLGRSNFLYIGGVFYAASPRMAGASAEEEIDEPTGKFLGPCRDGEYFKLRAYLIRAN